MVTARRGDPRTWLRAFVGFYRAQDASARELDPLARFLFSARSVILIISAQAAFIAGLLALTDRRFDPLDFLLVLVGFVIAHAISNLSNGLLRLPARPRHTRLASPPLHGPPAREWAPDTT